MKRFFAVFFGRAQHQVRHGGRHERHLPPVCADRRAPGGDRAVFEFFARRICAIRVREVLAGVVDRRGQDVLGFSRAGVHVPDPHVDAVSFVFRREIFCAREADVAPVFADRGQLRVTARHLFDRTAREVAPPHAGHAADRAVEGDILAVARDRRVVGVFGLLGPARRRRCPRRPARSARTRRAPAAPGAAQSSAAAARTIRGAECDACGEAPHRTLTHRLTTPAVAELVAHAHHHPVDARAGVAVAEASSAGARCGRRRS